MRSALFIAAGLLVAGGGIGLATQPAAASGTVIYDSTENPLPSNVPSLGYQATQTNQFGDEVTFAGTDRLLTSVTVTMSSWACESGGGGVTDNCQTTPGATFSWPITLNIYAPPASGPGTGALLGTVTQTFAIPYRPSKDDMHCTGNAVGDWYDGTACFSGLANNITFDLSAAQLTVPDTVIWGVVFNTTTYGPNPQTTDPCQATPRDARTTP